MWRQRSKIQDDGQVIDGEEDRQISHGLVGVKRVGGRRLRFKASEEPDFEQLRPTRAKWFTNKQTTYRFSERSIAGWPYREPSGFKKEDPFAYCWCTTKARRCSGPDRKVGSFWYPFTSSPGLVTWLWHYILHWLYTRIFDWLLWNLQDRPLATGPDKDSLRMSYARMLFQVQAKLIQIFLALFQCASAAKQR